MRVGFTPASAVGVASCLVLGLGVAGCTTPEAEPLTFRYHLTLAPLTLDPASANLRWSFGVIDRLFDGLMRFDRVRGEPDLELAASYEISEDNLVYEFRLVPDVRFHNNRIIQASDFKFAWERLLSPDTDSPKAWLLEMVEGADSYRNGDADAVDGIEVVDSHTLRIRLERPFASFLYHLAHPATSVVPEEAVRELGEEFGRQPVGSGPYRFVDWPDPARIVLEAFDQHSRRSPRVRSLIYEAEDDYDEALRRYKAGELDLVTQVPFGSEPELRKSLPSDLRIFPGASWAGFCFRCDRGLFQDHRMRRAFALALDREAFVREMGPDVRTAAVGFLPPTMPGHDPATLRSGFDPEQAAELLAAAGHRPGTKIPLRTLDGPLFHVMSRFLSTSLARLGVELSFETVDLDVYTTALTQGRMPLFFIVVTGEYPDPEPFLSPLFHRRGRSNSMAYENLEVDRLLEKAGSQLDPTDRLKLYQQAEQRIIADAPCVVLYQFDEAVLLQPRWRKIPVGYDPVFFEIELAEPVEDRALPPPLPSHLWSVVLGAGLAILVLTGAAVAASRSTTVQTALAVYRLSRVDPAKLPAQLTRTMARLVLGKKSGHAVLARVARWMARAGDEFRSGLAELMRATVPLMDLISSARVKADSATLHQLADALDQRIAAFEELVGEIAPSPGGPDDLQRLLEDQGADVWATARVVARQDRLFAALMRAESPGHLAVLRDDIWELAELARQFPDVPVLNRHFLDDLRGILEGLAPLHRLPSAEDRAPFLGQSLTRTLEAQEHLAGLSMAQPAFSLIVGSLALESVRQILATALRDLRQRADLVLELRSKVLAARREALVVLEIRNVGHGPAQNIEVVLRSDERHFRSLQSRQSVRGLLRQQSAQVEFLIEPRLSDRVRLTFALTYDDLERRDRRLEFADVVEFRQVEPRSFHPLLPNPYVVGRPLERSDIFIGRDETFSRIASNLAGAHQDNVVILVGQRRMGKTSILCRLSDHLDPVYLPVLVDLQAFLGSGEAAFFRELTAALHDGLKESGVRVQEPAAAEFAVDPGAVFRRRFLRDALRALGERKLLLMIDEFEIIEERICEGELKPRILPYLRSLVQHERRISFLFAGTHRLEQLTGDYWSVLFNLAVYLQVGHLSQDDVTQLFTRPAAPCFELDPLALDKAYFLTGGHPHFSQLLARELVDFRNRRSITYVTVQDVNTVAEIVADKGQLHIAYLWHEATRDERLLLLTLEQLLQREGMATIAAAHHYLSEHRVEVDDLPAAAYTLKQREILNDQGGMLTFRMGLLRLWMVRHYDLESFHLSEGRDPPSGMF